MCEAHNRVNRLLGKAEFSCELSQLDMRWCGAHDSPTPAAGRLTQFASLSDRRDAMLDGPSRGDDAGCD